MSANSGHSIALRPTLLRAARVGLVALGLAAALAVGGYAAATVFPDIGAQYVDVLRGIIGDAAVAQLETVIYQIQDRFDQWSYKFGVARPTSPWMAIPTGTPLANIVLAAPTEIIATETPAVVVGTFAPASTTTVPQITQTPIVAVATTWNPAPLIALGDLSGEGQWVGYLQNAVGQPLAYRTFLQPDPSRPYAIVAIVAFNLRVTRLHFVLGTDEPVSPYPIARPGRIHVQDFLAGRLLAAFNGGFKARQGQFGAMASGVTALPPLARLATVALYSNGQVRIGAWGTDIVTTPGIASWRQNGPLLIHNGQINPHTADNSPADWGASLTGESAVWRSGLGISADGTTLYYLAGPSLTLPALTRAAAATGAAQAMQLDINNYWVHFETIRWPTNQPAGKPTAEPLLDSMKRGDGRYLGSFSRDFFYVTADGS